MKEILINHYLNGKSINNKIKFIGTWTPFGIMTEKERDSELKFDKIDEGEEEMVYFVSPLPKTMLYHTIYFKSLEDNYT